MTTTAEAGLITQPGLYLGVPEDLYHRDPVSGGSLSSTGCRRIVDTCPAKFKFEQEHGRLATRSMLRGTAAHTVVLGTGKPLHVIEARDYRTKAAQESRDWALSEGLTPLLEHEYAEVAAMADALRAHPLANRLFSRQRHEGGRLIDRGGNAEVTGVWYDEPTGVACRMRLDWLPEPTEGRLKVGEYKTTTDASPEACAKTIARYGYHRQGAFYKSGLKALDVGGLDTEILFVFQETTAPYLVTVVQMSPEMYRSGLRMNRRGISLYAQCRQQGRWPGYNEEMIYTAELPAWQAKEEQ